MPPYIPSLQSGITPEREQAPKNTVNQGVRIFSFNRAAQIKVDVRHHSTCHKVNFTLLNMASGIVKLVNIARVIVMKIRENAILNIPRIKTTKGQTFNQATMEYPVLLKSRFWCKPGIHQHCPSIVCDKCYIVVEWYFVVFVHGGSAKKCPSSISVVTNLIT